MRCCQFDKLSTGSIADLLIGPGSLLAHDGGAAGRRRGCRVGAGAVGGRHKVAVGGAKVSCVAPVKHGPSGTQADGRRRRPCVPVGPGYSLLAPRRAATPQYGAHIGCGCDSRAAAYHALQHQRMREKSPSRSFEGSMRGEAGGRGQTGLACGLQAHGRTMRLIPGRLLSSRTLQTRFAFLKLAVTSPVLRAISAIMSMTIVVLALVPVFDH